jgi:hypothetical protein
MRIKTPLPQDKNPCIDIQNHSHKNMAELSSFLGVSRAPLYRTNAQGKVEQVDETTQVNDIEQASDIVSMNSNSTACQTPVVNNVLLPKNIAIVDSIEEIHGNDEPIDYAEEDDLQDITYNECDRWSGSNYELYKDIIHQKANSRALGI